MNENVEIKTIDTKDKKEINERILESYLAKTNNPFASLNVSDVAKDLEIGINQAYELFNQKDFPTIKIGRRKKVTLASYLLWKMKRNV